VVVDLLLAGDPFGGAKLVERLRKAGCPSDVIFVYSVMATSASRVDPKVRERVFSRLEKAGVSSRGGNVFGKLPDDAPRGAIEEDIAELATSPELVTAVLTRIGMLATGQPTSV
jgi:hypothetical protein